MYKSRISVPFPYKPNQATQPVHEYNLPRFTQVLVFVFALYLIIPIIEFPLVGLSLSAPIVYLVLLEVYLRPHKVSLRPFTHWIAFCYIFGMGIFIVFLANALMGHFAITASDILLLFVTGIGCSYF